MGVRVFKRVGVSVSRWIGGVFVPSATAFCVTIAGGEALQALGNPLDNISKMSKNRGLEGLFLILQMCGSIPANFQVNECDHTQHYATGKDHVCPQGR